MDRYKLAVLCIYLFPQLVCAQNFIRGKVSDSLSKEAVPYVNVWIKGSDKGSLTNDLGKFSIDVSGYLMDSIEFSLLGYQSKAFAISSLLNAESIEVHMNRKAVELKTAIITPIGPEEYIKRFVNSIKSNYNVEGKNERYYYREIIRENKNYNRFTEAVLDVYQPPLNAKKQDTSTIKIKGGHVLDNREYITFMRDYVEKQVKKENKKLVKKGEEPVDFTDASEYISFANPYIIVDSVFLSNLPSFLDSNFFSKYVYQFEYGYEYQGKSMICISFDQTKKISGNYFSGKIYMDENTYAIQGIDYGWNKKGKRKLLPALVKTAMYLFRMDLTEPDLQVKIRFRPLNDKWRLNHYKVTISGTLTKKYFFEENEKSHFNIGQDFVFIEPLETLNGSLKTLDRKQSMHKQIKSSSENVNWNTYRKLEPENLESY